VLQVLVKEAMLERLDGEEQRLQESRERMSRVAAAEQAVQRARDRAQGRRMVMQ
jgi:hypothetical protein